MYLAFVQALIATGGSLFFSEVMHFVPCDLCWAQRIFMYPLVLILGSGIYHKDKLIYRYVLPLSVTGMTISIYHNFIYYSTPKTSLFCKIGVACTAKYLDWFGFISIPLMALVAFGVINLCMLFVYRKNRNEN